MENSINAILSMDKEARELERQAEERRRTVSQTVARHRQDLQTAYEEGAAEAVRYTQEEQDKRLASERAAIDARQAAALSEMAEQVKRQHDGWVADLVRRVTEE